MNNPVAWSLENARQPILERARERLVALDTADPQRVIRLVVRRCYLNLIEIQPGQVIVHHWGQEGQGDLRPFFKTHSLTSKGFRVSLIDRKRETSTVQTGDDFLYGERLSPNWPWKVYWRKWQRRALQEPDDWTAAPLTWSGFAWEGIEPNRIPWACAEIGLAAHDSITLPELRPPDHLDQIRLSVDWDVQSQAAFHSRLRQMSEVVRGSVGRGRAEMDGGELGCRCLA